jgi:hypothetical protein
MAKRAAKVVPDMRPVVVAETHTAECAWGERCAVSACTASRLLHSLYCPACDRRTARAPNSLLARVWGADAAQMKEAAAAMTAWLEGQR